jgi:hypothetical protein
LTRKVWSQLGERHSSLKRFLAGATRGYRSHPQLIRFQAQPDSLAAIAAFLTGLAEEANRRGYHFDVSKILHRATKERISETRGQLLFEWKHLQKKLHVRGAASCSEVAENHGAKATSIVLRDSWEHKIVGEEMT